MKYIIEFKQSAKKDIIKLPKNIQPRVLKKIKQLEDNPTPSGCKKIIGTDNTWRVRVGTYRIIYDIFDEILVIKIIGVKHRKDAYD